MEIVQMALFLQFCCFLCFLGISLEFVKGLVVLES